MRIAKLATLTAAATLVVATAVGCSGGSDDDTEPTATTEATTNSDGTTVAGTELKVGDTAVVPFEADKEKTSQIKLEVSDVEKGKIADLDRFELNTKAKKSTVYYVHTKVRNLGPESLSGKQVTLYGKVSDDMVVPPVVFGSTFPQCDYEPLPKKFKKDKVAKGCQVMLAPKHGKISEVQWRPADNSEPISWSVKK
jgi:hypothetical protein